MYSTASESAAADAQSRDVDTPAAQVADPEAAGETVREAESTTRQRVLQLVVEEGPISAAALGTALQLTAAAVRRHLDAMTEQGILEVKNVTTRRRGAGRPSRRYVVSQRGQRTMGDDYLGLVKTALSLLEGDRDSSLEAGAAAQPESTQVAAAALARGYFAGFEQRWETELSEIRDLDARTERLSELFNEEGFAGFTRLVGRDNPLLAMQSTQLCQGHCPIREIAAAHPVFCEEETDMISRLLDVDVRRLSTQAAGAHVCTTHVPVGRERLAAEQRERAAASAEAELQISATAGATHSSRKVSGGRKRIVISPRQQERLS
ncbi:helix-turn-helix domain-containing protein [Nesterenkonia sp. E16_7]|uniref:helix-turn-helix transcriptional regulator n=1 Tax=unclassified Nesterenkonia TaxID=2629769 RepID=UPI001A918C3C|nr:MULTISPECIES: helix-turn-helix domain-containing protein [unclassified Nesterenkonia]MBO0596071.1 helix-turn-helix domain-containing protein [Nesterenkonia sp. E16_10]MBO0599327.1 helix-turn-helix domain-containing protein [Nesterenkonia sp. E16_7]